MEADETVWFSTQAAESTWSHFGEMVNFSLIFRLFQCFAKLVWFQVEFCFCASFDLFILFQTKRGSSVLYQNKMNIFGFGTVDWTKQSDI